MLRVMSWNVLWRFGDWRRREPAILSTLAGLQPDVAGLQEVWAAKGTTQAAWLADRLGMHAAYAVCPVPPGHGDELGVAVLSRWPLLRVREHLLPGESGAEPVVLLATIAHPSGPLHAATTCLDWEPNHGPQRQAQARELAALLTDSALDGPLPVLLTGDLNASPDTPEIRVLTEVLVDTWAVAGAGDGHTYSARNPLREARAGPDRRMDYVMVRAGTTRHTIGLERAHLAGEPVAGVQPSDHLAVVADLRLEPDASPRAAPLSRK